MTDEYSEPVLILPTFNQPRNSTAVGERFDPFRTQEHYRQDSRISVNLSKIDPPFKHNLMRAKDADELDNVMIKQI